MSAQIIDGKAVAARVQAGIRERIAAWVASGREAPVLATVLVGSDPASEIYVRNKRRSCAEVGIESRPIQFDAGIAQATLMAEIDRLNADHSVDGILVQFPLPRHLDSREVIERIRPDKDVDGFHPYNLGRLAQKLPTLRSCTPYGCIELLLSTGITLAGKRAVIVGASNHVGRPMMLELLLAGATPTITHSRTLDLAAEVARAEVLVVGVGQPNMVKGAWVREGAAVIDIGINRLPSGKLCGDVEFEGARERAAWITPVPGGVGPMTVAMLMANTLTAAQQRRGA